MTSHSIIPLMQRFKQWPGLIGRRRQRNLHYWASHESQLPAFVRQSPVACRYLRLLGPLAWPRFPERELRRSGQRQPIPYAALAASCLIKLDQHLVSMGALRQYLLDHPELVWLAFPRPGLDRWLKPSSAKRSPLKRANRRANPVKRVRSASLRVF